MKKVIFLLSFIFISTCFSFGSGKITETTKPVTKMESGNKPKKKYKKGRKKLNKKLGKRKGPKVKIFPQAPKDPKACSGVK